MYCQSCGKENTEQASFCQYCGKSINHQPIPTNPVSKLACPRCGKDDRVQKVSSIYYAGVTETNYKIPVNYMGTTTETVNSTAVSHTSLASRIAPPKILIINEILILLVILLVAIAILGTVGIVIGFLVGNDGIKELFMAVGSCVGTSIGVFIGSIVFVIAIVKINDSKKPQWEKRMSVWNSLYYCSRDDIVFKPETNLSVPSDRINDIVYRT